MALYLLLDKELVRYIHLNPFRAGLVNDLSSQDRLAYCGDNVLLGCKARPWQETDYISILFAGNRALSRK